MKRENLRRLFDISITLKLLHGVFEFILGFLILFVGAGSLVRVVEFIFNRELAEDSGDFIINLIITISQYLSVHLKSFIGIYFLIFGIINIWLAFILITKKVKHYTYVEAVIGIFILYQVYKFIRTGSVVILAFAIIDAIILWLIFKYHNSLLSQ